MEPKIYDNALEAKVAAVNECHQRALDAYANRATSCRRSQVGIVSFWGI
jgi:hypothetical protein